MSLGALTTQERLATMIETQLCENEERSFVKFRRKVRSAEVLSAAMQRLLQTIRFTGPSSVVMQNGPCSQVWVRGGALLAIGIATDGKLMVMVRFLTK
jgi:hypothetical protein